MNKIPKEKRIKDIRAFAEDFGVITEADISFLKKQNDMDMSDFEGLKLLDHQGMKRFNWYNKKTKMKGDFYDGVYFEGVKNGVPVYSVNGSKFSKVGNDIILIE